MAPSFLGLPGETQATIQETIRYATELNPHTMQVSLAAPYPGTFLHRQAVENKWLDADNAELVDDHGIQIAPLTYPTPLAHRDVRERRGILPALLLPGAEDCVDRGRDDQQPADDGATAPRGERILCVSA